MSGYIGPQPVPQAVMYSQTFTATASQTTFTTRGYQVGFIQVFLNGNLLWNSDEYTATNGSDVVLSAGADANDEVTVWVWTPFEAAWFNALDSNVDGNGYSLTNLGSLEVDGNVVFGDGGGFDMNVIGTRWQFSMNGTEYLRMTNTGLFGVNTSSPAVRFHIYEPSANANMRIESAGTNSYAHTNYKNDARRWNVGINTDDTFIIQDDTAGLTRVIVDASGNVGIGQTPTVYSNQTTLGIEGTTYGRIDLFSSSTRRASIYATSGSTTINSVGDLRFDAGNAESSRVLTSGTQVWAAQLRGRRLLFPSTLPVTFGHGE